MFCFFYFTSSVSFTGSYTEVKPFFKEKKMSKQKNLNILFCKAKLRLILYLPSFDIFGRYICGASGYEFRGYEVV